MVFLGVFIINFLLLITLLFCLVLIAVFTVFNLLPFMVSGVFFVPSSKKTVETMVILSEVGEGDKAIDLGSGDGRLVIAFAKAGAEAHGYEINPLLVWLSRQKIRQAGLSKKAFIHQKNFWDINFSEFTVVSVYGITYMMKKLEIKFEKELKPGSRVLSNAFAFPHWKYVKSAGSVYLYKK